MIAQSAPSKFKQFAKYVFDCDDAMQGIDALEQLIVDCGLPTKLSDLDSTCEITEEILEKVANSSRIIESAVGDLNSEKILTILKQCM